MDTLNHSPFNFPSVPTALSRCAWLISSISQGSLSADENSIYRALSRFQNMEIVASETQPSNRVPTGVITT